MMYPWGIGLTQRYNDPNRIKDSLKGDARTITTKIEAWPIKYVHLIVRE
jgi:hypothetical protein